MNNLARLVMSTLFDQAFGLVLPRIQEAVKRDLMEDLLGKVRKVMLLFFSGLITTALFLAGFLFLFTEAMSQLDEVGTLYWSAHLIGSASLLVFSLLGFTLLWAIAKRGDGKKEEASQAPNAAYTILHSFVEGWRSRSHPEVYSAPHHPHYKNGAVSLSDRRTA